MSTLRLITTLILSSGGVILLGKNFPIQKLDFNLSLILAVFRISYSALIIIRLIRGWEAIPIIQGWGNEAKYQKYYIIWIINTIFLALGFFTPLAAFVNYLFCFFIWRKQKEYSVEDLLFRLISFHLIFLDSGRLLSIDQNIGFFSFFENNNPIFINFFILNILLSFFSAGFEKIKSDVWNKSLGFYYFIAIPYFVNPWFKFLRKNWTLCAFANWVTIIIEIFALITLVDSKINFIILFGLLIFSLSLFIIVDLSFIGQISTLLVLFLIFVNYLTPAYSISNINNALFVDNIGMSIIIYGLWSLTVIECIYYKPFSSKIGNWIVIATTTLLPLVVFNGIHYFGLYIFRLRGYSDGKYFETLNVFNDDGSRGKMQIWYPRNFQNAIYAVTDLCIAYINNLDDRINWRIPQIIDLCYVGRNQLMKKNVIPEKIYLEVKLLSPSKTYTEDPSDWLDKEWQTIGYTDFSGSEPSWIQQGKIPKYKFTKRWPVQNKITSTSDYRKK